MTDTAPTPPAARLADHARRVAPFQWKLLAIFLTVGVISGGVYAYAALSHPARSHAASHVNAPGGSSGFLGASDSPAGSTDSADSTGAASDTWTGWTGAKGTALGFGFVGGFVIGFIFRAFLKLMMLITILIGGGLMALSYFHILNIDFTAARTAYDNNAQWITDQAIRLKDVLVAHLPSSSTGAVGAFFGLRRR